LKSRVLTALILIPVVLAVMMSASPWPLFGLSALISGLAFVELSRFGRIEKASFPILAALLFIGFALYAMSAAGWIPIAQLAGLSLFGALVAPQWVARKSRVLLETASCWFVCPLLSLCVLQAMFASSGRWWIPTSPLLLIVLPLWVGDSLAYFVGRSIGKHLLAPKISPKKTVEGAVANLFACVVAAAGIAVLVALPVWIGVACGLMAGTLGQAGDLFESSLKRAAGVKDAGGLLPGHGGILDRIDSLLFAAPFEALLIAAVWPQIK
jgi:phosphatidate cytidylyltransferase